MDDFENFKEGKKGVKVLIGMSDVIEKQAAEFEKTHKILKIIQKCETQMFIFYINEGEKEK